MAKMSELQEAASENDRNMKNNLVVLQQRTTEILQQSAKISNLEDTLAKLESAKAALDERCIFQGEQLSTTEKERDRLSNALAEMNSVLQEKASLIEELESKLETTNAGANKAKEEFEKKLSILEKKLVEVQKTTDEAIGALEQKQEELSRRDSKISSLEEVLQSKDVELDEHAERVRLFEEDLSEKRRAVENLERERSSLEEQLTVQKQAFDQMDSKGKQQEASLREEIGKLNRALSTAQASVTNLEREKKSQEECTIALKKDFESQIAAADARLAEREREHEAKINELNEELASGKRELELQMMVVCEREQQMRDANAHLETAQSAAKQAQSKCAELEKKVASWTEEKKALLERCLNSESDLDFERERAAENKRRFDDALSAMHELGRANQSLQMDISKQFNRKWLDDSEAVNCNFCGKAFSLTIRKHHCRQCGLIFCAQCSSKTASVPSHKNPVRVCNNCHEDISNR
ncbi:Early endosome antigen 1 [Toxocara canis]|nr:Early endosome antigen 1 [Toxocara canis]